MKKIIYFIVLLMFMSCTKLDINVYDSIPENKFPEDPAQAALMMIPVYNPMSKFLDDGFDASGKGIGGWWFCQELTSDEMVCPIRNTDWNDGGKWAALYKHTWDNQTEAVTDMWPLFYSAISTTNKIYESLLSGAGTMAGDLTLAKLRIMRAYYYYLLIDNYGDVPYITTFKNAPNNPYRNHRAAIWDSIVHDITISLPYLNSSTSKTAVTKGMAFSLLAKLYLNSVVYTGNPQWAKAGAYCDSVINLNAYSLETSPLAPFITANKTSVENIFTIPFDENSEKGFNLHMRTLHYNSNLTFNMTVGPWNGFAVTEDFYNTYSPADKRVQGNNTFGIGNNKGYFLVGQQFTSAGAKIYDAGAGNDASGNPIPLILNPHIPQLEMTAATNTPIEIRMSGARVVKFEVKLGASDNLSNSFPIFRFADILLMKSEALIRQGQNGDAPFNLIRDRAGIPELTNVGLDSLLAERGREMFWEAHRRQDLIRFDDALHSWSRTWWEKPADDNYTTRKTFPIPQAQTDANPNLLRDVQ